MAQAIPGIEDKARNGILMMLAAWLMFSCVDTGAKWVAVIGLPAIQIAFFRYIGHFVISSGIMLRARDGWELPPHFLLVSVRGALLVAATVSNFWILKVLPLTVTSAIMFSSPVIVCFFSVMFLKERVGPWRWGAILLGFAGVLIVIRPFGAAFDPLMLFAVGNSVVLAIYSLLTRKLAGKVSTDVMQFWMGFWGTAVLLPLVLVQWETPSSGTQWAVLISLGFFAWAGHQWLTTAHRFATANTLMPFTYSFLIYLTIFGYVLFDHVPSVWTLVGAAVIMVSGLIIWWREGGPA